MVLIGTLTVGVTLAFYAVMTIIFVVVAAILLIVNRRRQGTRRPFS